MFVEIRYSKDNRPCKYKRHQVTHPANTYDYKLPTLKTNTTTGDKPSKHIRQQVTHYTNTYEYR